MGTFQHYFATRAHSIFALGRFSQSSVFATVLAVFSILFVVHSTQPRAVPFSNPTFVDNAFTFTGIFTESDISGVDRQFFDASSVSPRGSRFWRLDVGIRDFDGGGLIEDTLELIILAQHLISPSGLDHNKDVDPNTTFRVNRTIGAPGEYDPGLNRFNFGLEFGHPNGNHKDQFGAQLNVFVDDDEFNVAAYQLIVTGTHKAPTPATLPLFLAGLAGLGFFSWRKKSAAKI